MTDHFSDFAAAQTKACGTWLPIATAPKDVEVLIGRWVDDEFVFGRSVQFYEHGNPLEEDFSGYVWAIEDCPDSLAEAPEFWSPIPKPPSRNLAEPQANRDHSITSVCECCVADSMTLRDRLACRALKGLMTRDWPETSVDELPIVWAESSYRIADAMLEARK